MYFNPRSPHRERHYWTAHYLGAKNFNPRSPHRERPIIIYVTLTCYIFQSTLPSQGATVRYIGSGLGVENFNPRSPHRERHRTEKGWRGSKIFQSTLPSQGATCLTNASKSQLSISIHAPLTGSDKAKEGVTADQLISIHAPLTGSDLPR